MRRSTQRPRLTHALRALAREFRDRLVDQHAELSYALEGEDMVLRRLFEGKTRGFYVDVGAHHPRRFSNTYYFYRRARRGINIDAAPGSMEAFNRDRSRD